MPAELLSAIAAVLFLRIVLMIFYTGFNVGRARSATKIAAPATSGHPTLDRAYRVQMNTVEQAVVFFPLLWIATIYFQSPGPGCRRCSG